MTLFKPMLATDADLKKLRFPLLASAKLDGVRAIVRDGVVYSRSNKPIPNVFVQETFKGLDHADGELIVGLPTAKDCMQATMSGVMSKDGEPDVRFFLFDHVRFPNKPYIERRQNLHFDLIRNKRLMMVDQHVVLDLNSLLKLEQVYLDLGYEGLILRDQHAPYKFGRSTVNEGYLLKMKRFVDAEAKVIGFEERMHNGNEATISELGRTKRSSHKANKTGRGDLGALVCVYEGVEFSIGTGFTDDQRDSIWTSRDKYLGMFAKFKYFPVGVKEAPRHPVFLGWRDPRDMS